MQLWGCMVPEGMVPSADSSKAPCCLSAPAPPPRERAGMAYDADRGRAVMFDGRLLQIDRPADLYDSPINQTVAAFVGQANLWEGRVAADGRQPRSRRGHVGDGDALGDRRQGGRVEQVGAEDRRRILSRRVEFGGKRLRFGANAADVGLQSVDRALEGVDAVGIRFNCRRELLSTKFERAFDRLDPRHGVGGEISEEAARDLDEGQCLDNQERQGPRPEAAGSEPDRAHKTGDQVERRPATQFLLPLATPLEPLYASGYPGHEPTPCSVTPAGRAPSAIDGNSMSPGATGLPGRKLIRTASST